MQRKITLDEILRNKKLKFLRRKDLYFMINRRIIEGLHSFGSLLGQGVVQVIFHS
jgi:hypothetical protein